MLIVLIVLLFCLTGCIDNGYSPSDEPSMVVLKGFLHAGKPVDNVRLTYLTEYEFVDDSIEDHEEPITHAHVVLKWDDSSTVLLHTDKGYYSADHIVKQGKTYSIDILVKDSITNKETIVRAETAVPLKPENLSLSQDTLYSEDSLDFQALLDDTNDYAHTWLTIGSDNNSSYYLEITCVEPIEGILFDEFFLLPPFFEPFEGNRYNIKLIDLRFFGKHQVIVNKINKEFINLFKIDYDSWTSLHPEAITNVHNGWGVFTALNCDTIFFDLIKE